MEINMTIGIYKIECAVNGKIYIGSSVNVEKRWSDHRWQLNNKIHSNPHLQSAWILYGSETFIFSLIEECLDSEILIREQYYLDILFKDANTFNIATIAGSAQKGKKLSEDHKRKISEGNKGKVVSEETKRKMSESQKGKKKTPEQIENHRSKLIGKKASESTKLKMSNTRKGRKHSEEVKEKIRNKHWANNGVDMLKEVSNKISEGHKRKKRC